MPGGSDEGREHVRVRSTVESGQAMQLQGQFHLCSGDVTHLQMCVCVCACVYVYEGNKTCLQMCVCVCVRGTYKNYAIGYKKITIVFTYLNDIHEPSPGQGIDSC